MRLFLIGAAAFAAAVAHSAPAQDPPAAAASPDAAQVARGKALFDTIGCVACHGTAGQGGIGPMAGPRVAAREELPLEAFSYMVRHPAAVMPPYSEKVLSEAQVADLHAYLAGSFRPGHAADIPMLRPPR